MDTDTPSKIHTDTDDNTDPPLRIYIDRDTWLRIHTDTDTHTNSRGQAYMDTPAE